MERITLDSIFSPVSERARTPFYSSFIISWMFINWKVIYATLFFDKEDLKGFDIVNYLIHVHYINLYDNFLWPLASALGYIFVYPWFDRGVFYYTELRKREKLDDKIKIGRKFAVDGNKYWDLHKKLEETLERFNTINENNIELNSRIIAKDREIFDLTSQANDLRRNVESVNSNLEKLRSRNDPNKFFQEPWQFNIDGGGSIYPFNSNVLYEIRDRKIVRHLGQQEVGTILFFERDMFLNRMRMLVSSNGGNNMLFLDLHIDANNIYSGMLNNKRVSITKELNSTV